MKQQPQFEEYRALIDKDVVAYGKKMLVEADTAYGPHSAKAVEAFVSILTRGGKRLRGILMLISYEMLGGSDPKTALSVARALEMVHASLLIFDDIADRSVVRRSGPTAHIFLKDYHEQHKLRGDSSHFGKATAMHAAGLGGHLAEKVIDDTDLPDQVKLSLLRCLRNTLIQTYHGQLNDIFNAALSDVDQEYVFKVAELKTAYYSVINPLEVGALMAGANDKDIDLLRRCGLYAGLAFQITDDILGIFSDEAVAGKSPLDDLKEGKMTVLMASMFERSTKEQRKQLTDILGNPDISEKDLAWCRHLAVETGALKHTKALANKLSEKADRIIKDAPKTWDPKFVGLLRALNRTFVNRQS